MAVFRRKISIEILKIDSWNLSISKTPAIFFLMKQALNMKGIHFQISLFHMSAENMLCRHNAVYCR